MSSLWQEWVDMEFNEWDEWQKKELKEKEIFTPFPTSPL